MLDQGSCILSIRAPKTFHFHADTQIAIRISWGQGRMNRDLPLVGGYMRALPRGSSQPTCMEFFLSSGCLGFTGSLLGAGGAVLPPVACDRVPGAREGVKGPKRERSLAA
jgi:hypothetical protein